MKPNTKIYIDVPSDLKRSLKVAAAMHDCSMQSYIIQVLSKHAAGTKKLAKVK